MLESIVAVAVLIENGRIVASLTKPNRHHDILHALAKNNFPTPTPESQGFLTNNGRFVTREEAVDIALSAGQISIPKLTDPQNQLFSEDLW